MKRSTEAKRGTETNRRLKTLSQILFLLLFVLLVRTGRHMQWMKIFLISAALAVPFGRFYCGWICPMNTLMGVTNWLGKRLGIQTDTAPTALRSGRWAYGLLVLLLVLAGLNAARGVKLPFLLIMLALALLVTLRYRPLVWHRYLCPYGLILGALAKSAPLKMTVNDACSGCTLCQKACPGEAISMKDERALISSQHCLECLDCQAVCPKDAITYRAGRQQSAV